MTIRHESPTHDADVTVRRGRGWRLAVGSVAAAAALVAGGAATASAAPPPSDPAACGAYATGGSNGATMTMKLFGHACGSPVPWFGRVYLQAQMNGDVIYSKTIECQGSDSAAYSACIDNGLSYSTADPAGVQHWEWGGQVDYYSTITYQPIGTSYSITTADY